MSKRPVVCPVCRSRPDRIRLTAAGTQHGCGKCGEWFGTDESGVPDEPAPQTPPETPGDQGGSPLGPHGLTRLSVALGLRSRTLSGAVEELVPKALHGSRVFLKSEEIAKALRDSLGLGAVEFRRGLAFLHSRVDELAEPRASLGISPEGLDPGTLLQGRIFVVVLFLKPAHDPGFEIPLWAKRKLCNERTVYKLRTAPDLDAVLEILKSA